jgi:hypothetical protein
MISSMVSISPSPSVETAPSLAGGVMTALLIGYGPSIH